ncbi:MAG: hypothetical protein Q9210_005398 [Variospora velana]
MLGKANEADSAIEGSTVPGSTHFRRTGGHGHGLESALCMGMQELASEGRPDPRAAALEANASSTEGVGRP